jgi:hypothetical protein
MGIRAVALDAIRGSVGRYRDFTNEFFPRKKHMKDRWKRVNKLALSKGLPPIELYKVGEAFFVLDGNHRVSVARNLGMETIDAHVWEFDIPVGLSSEADMEELIIKEEYAGFLARTRLNRERPGQNIVFTSTGQFLELEYQIESYRRAQEETNGETIPYEKAVVLWYDMFYKPAIDIILKERILKKFPGRTAADLYIWCWHRYMQSKRTGPIFKLRAFTGYFIKNYSS